jgi:hypothetical protein
LGFFAFFLEKKPELGGKRDDWQRSSNLQAISQIVQASGALFFEPAALWLVGQSPLREFSAPRASLPAQTPGSAIIAYL